MLRRLPMDLTLPRSSIRLSPSSRFCSSFPPSISSNSLCQCFFARVWQQTEQRSQFSHSVQWQRLPRMGCTLQMSHSQSLKTYSSSAGISCRRVPAEVKVKGLRSLGWEGVLGSSGLSLFLVSCSSMEQSISMWTMDSSGLRGLCSGVVCCEMRQLVVGLQLSPNTSSSISTSSCPLMKIFPIARLSVLLSMSSCSMLISDTLLIPLNLPLWAMVGEPSLDCWDCSRVSLLESLTVRISNSWPYFLGQPESSLHSPHTCVCSPSLSQLRQASQTSSMGWLQAPQVISISSWQLDASSDSNSSEIFFMLRGLLRASCSTFWAWLRTICSGWFMWLPFPLLQQSLHTAQSSHTSHTRQLNSQHSLQQHLQLGAVSPGWLSSWMLRLLPQSHPFLLVSSFTGSAGTIFFSICSSNAAKGCTSPTSCESPHCLQGVG